MSDATRLLARLGAGDRDAAEALLPLIRDELHAVAHRHLRREPPGHTLQTTLLADEAYLRLIDQREVEWAGRAHFYAIASRIIRRLLVDHARRRDAARRGGDRARLTLSAVGGAASVDAVDMLALEEALERLAALDDRQAQVVELRFFGGLGVEETATVLGVAPRTVESDWQMARAWLKRALGEDAT